MAVARACRRQANRSTLCLVATGMLVAAALTQSPRADAGQTIVSLTFDDGLSQSQVGSILRYHGLKATFYVNSNRIGSGGAYLKKSELDTLIADGNEIGGHTISHVNLATLSDADQEAAICNDLATLNTWYPGQIHSFAYPYGSTGPTTQSIVAKGCPGIGQYSARAAGGLYSSSRCVICPTAETIPPANPYYILTTQSADINTTLDELKSYVTKAENNGGGWVPLVFHGVCDDCGPYSMSPAVLDAFLAWLKTREPNNTYVRTVHQVMAGDIPPPPSPPFLGENLLINPSMELDRDANSQPDCWQRGGYGTNTATWTRTSDAHTGSFAQQVQITYYSSGDRKLVPTQDAGQATGGCAPMVAAGASYQIGAWYKSSAITRAVLFYRNANGAWQYWKDGPKLGPTTNWTQMSFATGPLPAGATAMSFGIALDSIGTLTTDDYSLQKILDGSSVTP